MRIAIRFSPPQKSLGGSQMTIAENLIPALSNVHQDIVLFTNNAKAFPAVFKHECVSARDLGATKSKMSFLVNRLLDQLMFERDLRRYGCDVVYYPYTHESLLFTVSVPQVITVHDMIPLIYPELFPLMSMQWKYWTIPSLRSAKKIITVSCNTKKDIVNLIGLDSNKIHVIRNGYRPHILRDVKLSENKYGKYILYVSSSLYPFKNILRLLRALAILKNDIPHKLIIVGKSVPRFAAQLSEEVTILDLKDRLIFLEDLPNYDLMNLYQYAELFVYPSLYEGFGIPPLEAMSSGVPVLASNATSIPEVCGDAAFYFNPESVEDIAQAVLSALNDQKLRDDLISKGTKRIMLFEWENSARQIVDVCKLAAHSE